MQTRERLDQYFLLLKAIKDGLKLDASVSIDPLNQSPSELTPDQQGVLDAFWNTPIDYLESSLTVIKSPFIVMEESPMSKVHFLFLMLNVSQMTVVSKGTVVGMITKNEFIKKRKEEPIAKKRQPSQS